jgi:hypothetical protein
MTACWIRVATNTHSKCVLLIAFPLQWLHERASVLQVHSLSFINFVPLTLLHNSDLRDSQLSYIAQFGSLSCHLCDAYMLPWKRHQNDVSTAGELGVVTGEAVDDDPGCLALTESQFRILNSTYSTMKHLYLFIYLLLFFVLFCFCGSRSREYVLFNV